VLKKNFLFEQPRKLIKPGDYIEQTAGFDTAGRPSRATNCRRASNETDHATLEGMPEDTPEGITKDPYSPPAVLLRCSMMSFAWILQVQQDRALFQALPWLP
jgi:hypothetical protein